MIIFTWNPPTRQSRSKYECLWSFYYKVPIAVFVSACWACLNVTQFLLTHILKDQLDISIHILEAILVKAERSSDYQKFYPSGNQMKLPILFKEIQRHKSTLTISEVKSPPWKQGIVLWKVHKKPYSAEMETLS